MSSEFDPYRKWLGIPANEQPVNHYRLLGLVLFESDADVISNAADRQMAHVRTFQTGKYSAQSQKLLNELSAARVTLLDPTKKAEYDAKLQSEMDASAGASVVNLGVHVPPPQGSFAGVSGINAPPIANGESSMLGMPLDLSSTSNKKHASHDKKVKNPPVTNHTHSSGKRGSSKPTVAKSDNSLILYAGVGGGMALIVIIVVALLATSASKHVTSNDVDTNDYSQVQMNTPKYIEPLQQKPVPEKKEQHKQEHKAEQKSPDKGNTENTNTTLDTFEMPEATSDVPDVPLADNSKDDNKDDNDHRGEHKGPRKHPKHRGTKDTDTQSEVDDSLSSDSDDNDTSTDEKLSDSEDESGNTIDLANLENQSGLVKTYRCFAEPVFKATIDDSEQTRIPTLSLDTKTGFMYVGNNAKGDSSVLNLQTGAVEHEFSPSEIGHFVAFNVSNDGQQYYLAISPTKMQLMSYQSETNSSDFLSPSDPTDCRPNSFIFRWDADGQPHKESNNSHAFYTAKGYEILNIATPVQCDSGTMAVGLSDGLIHVISMESGDEYMCFYPSDSEPPAGNWKKDIEDNKKTNFKKFFYILAPESVPTALAYNSDAKYLATGNSNGEVFVWDIESGNPVSDSEIDKFSQLEHKFSVKNFSKVLDLHFDSTGKYLYIFWSNGQMGKWDWLAQKEVKTYNTGFPIQYAQIMGDKYLLTQNRAGEVKIWDWDSEDVKPVGRFLKQTDSVIADAEKLVFSATNKGDAKPQLSLYALPKDFVEAEKSAQFAKDFRAIVIYPVPEESQWQAKVDEVQGMINKALANVPTENKAGTICTMSRKVAESRKLDPTTRYALYMQLLSAMVDLQDRDKISVLVDDISQEFEADKLELKVQAYFQLLPKQKRFEALKTADMLLDLAQKIAKTGGYQRALQIVEQVRKGNLSDDLRSKSMTLLKVYKDELKKNQKSN